MIRILRHLHASLEALGVELAYGTRVANLLLRGGRCCGVELADGRSLTAEAVVLAVGHSARDMYERLHQQAQVALEFQVREAFYLSPFLKSW